MSALCAGQGAKKPRPKPGLCSVRLRGCSLEAEQARDTAGRRAQVGAVTITIDERAAAEVPARASTPGVRLEVVGIRVVVADEHAEGRVVELPFGIRAERGHVAVATAGDVEIAPSGCNANAEIVGQEEAGLAINAPERGVDVVGVRIGDVRAEGDA